MDRDYPVLNKREFRLFRSIVHDRSGIFLDDYKQDSLKADLNILMRQRDITSYDDYLKVLNDKNEGEAELRKLLDLVTVNETCFFRNPAQFEALRKTVLPEIIRQKQAAGDNTIKIWSAGCSTGEEPYSIAMTLLEFLPNPKDWRVEIQATDVSNQVLSDAQKGQYRSRTLRETPDFYLRKYFTPTDDGEFILDRAVRDMVSFQYHNLVTEQYPILVFGGWDIIFCRNVTIYFQLESVKKVIRDFYDALRDGGYLFIGHAESLYKINEEFVPVHLGGAYVYKKDTACLEKSDGEQKATLCLVDFAKPEATVPDLAPAERAGLRRDEDRKALYGEAYERFAREEFEEAARLANRLVKVDPDNIEGHVLLANIYINQNRVERANKEVTIILEKQPLSTKGHYLMGLIREKQGQLDEAAREFKRVIYIDSGFALAHINLANIYKAKNMAAEAAKEYNIAIIALAASPRGDWVDFAGGFLADVLVEVCKRNLAQMA